MKNILLLLLLMASGALSLRAQQDHQYTQFMYNKLLINPGYAGARGIPFVTAIYRNQWLGFDGAPESALVSFNSNLLSNRVGVGVTLSNNRIGLMRDFQANLAYSYDLLTSDQMSLHAGIMGSVRSLSIDFDKALAVDPAMGDASLDVQRSNQIIGNVGAGLYGLFADRFYVGFSVPRIYANKIGINENGGDNIAKEARHYYGMAGAILPVSEDISLMPSILTKYVKNAPFDVDINMNVDIKAKVTAGVSYRLGGDGAGESLDLLMFWQAMPLLGLGVAYDFTLSNLRDYSTGSVEVLILADLKKTPAKGGKPLANPRYFL
ncbi:MAG: PorP/SprF family type IX secretion system membrane protein [Saprospiraceae bacterium]